MRTEAEQKDSRSQIRARELDQGPAFRNSLRISAVSCLCVIALVLTSCEEKEARPQMAPPEVEVAEVVQQDVPIFEEWVAQLNGPTNAEITPKVQGYLLTQNYENGYFVKKGQLLYTIDPRPFIAQLDQAKAEVAVADANVSRTQADVDRDTPLAAQNAIPKKQLDNDVASGIESRLDQSLFPGGRNRRRHEFADWRSGGDEHQDDHDLPGKSHLGLLQHQRKRISQRCPTNYPDHPRSRKPEEWSVGGVHSGRRTSLPGARPDYLCESSGRNSNRHHPVGCAVSQ